MITNDKTMKMIRDAYARDNLPTWPEPLPLKKALCWAVSFCSVMVIVASIIASM